VALEPSTARVLEHDVVGHQRDHCIDIVLVEGLVEARSRRRCL
jgi:hypothetical protein